jgi:hypothetical protein
MSDAEIATLERDGVVGDTPIMAVSEAQIQRIVNFPVDVYFRQGSLRPIAHGSAVAR